MSFYPSKKNTKTQAHKNKNFIFLTEKHKNRQILILCPFCLYAKISYVTSAFCPYVLFLSDPSDLSDKSDKLQQTNQL